MKSFKTMVTEGSKDETTRLMLKGMDNVLYNDLRQRFYGVADNLDEFVTKLNATNGATGEFDADLKLAKQMQKLFDKMTLGKFL